MSFAALSGAALAAIAGAIACVVLALYLLRRTPKPRLVSNVSFWLRAAETSRPRVLRSIRIPWLAFLVSLLIALLFVAELGDPRFGRSVRGTTVIVLAAGRSMGASHRGETRIEQAIREVRSWVDRTTIGGQVAVVRAGMRPETLLGLTEDPTDLERALRDFTLDDGPSDLESALRLADRIVASSGGAGQVLLVADRDVEFETEATRVLIPVGVPGDTLAIVDFTARRDPLAAGEYVAEVVLQSFSEREASARLRVLDGDVQLLNRRLTLHPGQVVRLSAQGFSSERAELEARLSEIAIVGSEDALAADDVAYAVLPPLEPLRVLLVTPGNDYLEAALAVHPNAIVERISQSELARREEASLHAYDVLVLDRTKLPTGLAHRAVLLFSPPSHEFVTAEEARSPRITASMASHPVLRGVRLDNLRIGRALRFEVQAGDQVLIRSGADALAIARESDEGRRLVFGIHLDETDLVEREAFPLLVHRALGWAAHSRDDMPLPRRLGEPLRAAPGEIVLGPTGEPESPSGLSSVRRQGIYHVGERAVAFSGVEHAEALGAGTTGGRLRSSAPLPPLSLLLAGLLLALIVLEWALLHRGRLQ